VSRPVPDLPASTIRVLNALVERRPRFLNVLQVHGASDVSISTARAACCELARLGLVEKLPVRSPFIGEAATMTYGARAGVSGMEVPAPKRRRTSKLGRPAYQKVRSAMHVMPPGVLIADVARATGLDIGTTGTVLRDLLEAGEVTRTAGESHAGGQRPWLWSRAEPAEVAACL